LALARSAVPNIQTFEWLTPCEPFSYNYKISDVFFASQFLTF
jgi:hypothetical protein